MEKHKNIELPVQKIKKSHTLQYDSLDAALKAKNDMARDYLKTAKLP